MKLRSKYFWKIFNDEKSNSTYLPNEMSLETVTAMGAQLLCKLLSSYFQSVYMNIMQNTSTQWQHSCLDVNLG